MIYMSSRVISGGNFYGLPHRLYQDKKDANENFKSLKYRDNNKESIRKSLSLINLNHTKKLTIKDFGYSTNFKHLQHVKWNNDTGFDIEIIEPGLQRFSEKQVSQRKN